MLLKNFFRELTSTLSRLVSVIIITAVAVMMFVALRGLSYNTDRINNSYYNANNVADFWISGTGLSRTDLRKIAALEMVEAVQPRIIFEAEERNNDSVTLSLYGIADGYYINTPYLVSGNYPKSNREMLLSAGFAEAHGLSPGDTYDMLLRGTGKTLSLTISGTAEDPECMYHISAETLAPDYTRYGFAYMDESVLADILGKNTYNQFCVKLEENADKEAFKAEIHKILGGRLQTILALEDNTNAHFLLDQLDILRLVTLLFPIIFFLVAALIMFSTMSRVIDGNRTMIGTLKALGYSDRQIMFYYLGYSQIVVVLGYLIGALPANRFLTVPISGLLFNVTRLPPYTIQLDPWSLVIAFVLTNIFCTGTAFIVTRRAIRENPAECMRPKPPKASRKIFFERLPAVWNRLNFTQKYIVRNITRNKLRMLICICGVMGCMALNITALGINDSLNNFSYLLGNKLHQYDVMAVFSRDITTGQSSHLARLEGVSAVQYEMTTGARFYSEDKKETGSITVCDDTLTLKLFDISGADTVDMPKDGAVISEKLAKKLGLSPGDTLLAECLENNKTHTIQIVRTCGNIDGIYLSKSFWRGLGEYFLPTAAYLNSTNPDQLLARLSDYDFVSTQKTRSDVVSVITNQLVTMNVVVVILIVFGGILALVVLYNLGIMNFLEQTRSLATLMVLGFRDKEIRALMLTENILFAVFGALFGLPCGIYLHRMIIGSIESFNIPVYATVWTYVVSGILTILFALIVNMVLSKKMKTIDMLGALKSVE